MLRKRGNTCNSKISYATLAELEGKLHYDRGKKSGEAASKHEYVFNIFNNVMSSVTEIDFFRNRAVMMQYHHALECHFSELDRPITRLTYLIYFGYKEEAIEYYKKMSVQDRANVISKGLFEFAHTCQFWEFTSKFIDSLRVNSRIAILTNPRSQWMYNIDRHLICAKNPQDVICTTTFDGVNPLSQTIPVYGTKIDE